MADIENVLIRVGNRTIRLDHVEQFTVRRFDEDWIEVFVSFASGREVSFSTEEAEALKSALLSIGIDLGDGTRTPDENFAVFEA